MIEQPSVPIAYHEGIDDEMMIMMMSQTVLCMEKSAAYS
jgi:hypothetical protein